MFTGNVITDKLFRPKFNPIILFTSNRILFYILLLKLDK